MIGAYVINLASAGSRRQRISAQLERLGVPFQVFAAVDGRALPEHDVARRYDAAAAAVRYRPMSRGEVGCALSHLGVCRQMLEDDAAFALVLEDDALLGDDLPAVLADLEARLDPDRAEVVLLSHVDKYTRWGTRPLGHGRKLVRRYGEWWRAHGYVVTRAAAERMLAGLQPVWCAADYWSAFEKQGLVTVRAVVPYCIGLTELAQDSALEGHRADLDASDKARRSIGYYLRRYVYQRFLFQVFVRPFLRVARQKRAG
ncbi:MULTISPECIES: glycosyltransferase family 25 protein [Cupriavidus]|uniref:Glycosyltransferase family 25 protein n=1 Tax=Cupriavidus oxalaticus TaxID=96344 RepID=A0A4P7LGT2_9BURK|nr:MULTISPECIES: glycosyltransferase family 25 protein [Cupriavidus]QBY52443.1 glycosyltransferase family 25 protein [Cupriavidus oxalaticus]TDF66301.1 glycosyltransferase family 25 protein [Cupriavidus sp. L7L]